LPDAGRPGFVRLELGIAVEALFSPEPTDWFVRRLVKQLDGLTPSDVRAALARAHVFWHTNG
jgi:hypothetical protein